MNTYEPSGNFSKSGISQDVFKRSARNQHESEIIGSDRDSDHAITIGLPPDLVFAFWRDFSNLSLFLKDISKIENLSSTRSKWTVKFRNGMSTDWIAEITDEVPGESISWASVEGEVKTEGTVRFQKAPGDLGTEVRLSMDYYIPGGKLTEFATLWTGEDPETLIQISLKRLKGFLETGEIATIEGQSPGRDDEEGTTNLDKTFH